MNIVKLLLASARRMRYWLAALLNSARGFKPVPQSANAARAASTAGCSPNCAYKDEEHNSTAPSLVRHYKLNVAEIPDAYHCVIEPLELDSETKAFIDSCRTNWLLDMAATVLRWFMSLTDTNGMLGRGQMFVLSSEACTSLLGLATAEARLAGRAQLALLDVGAGDGEVTSRIVKGGNFSKVFCTEVSKPMASRLSSRGWSTKVTSHISKAVFPEDGMFDVVSLMNLLDRCDQPLDMLKDAARLAVPDTGRVLIALVLPFSEFVEDGTKRRAPYGALPMRGARCQDGVSFEASLSAFLTRAVKPAGLVVERIARVPYLCRGDRHKRYYVLSDAILVLRHATQAEQERGVVTVAGTTLGSL